MSTGSGLWHFLYHLVRKFIRSVVSSEKTWQLRHIIMVHFGNGDKPNKAALISVSSALSQTPGASFLNILGRFLFPGKDAHFRNFFGKHLWKIFLRRFLATSVCK